MKLNYLEQMERTQAELDLEQRLRNKNITSNEELEVELIDVYFENFGEFGTNEFEDFFLPTLEEIHHTNIEAAGLETLTLFEHMRSNISFPVVGNYLRLWASENQYRIVEEHTKKKNPLRFVTDNGLYNTDTPLNLLIQLDSALEIYDPINSPIARLDLELKAGRYIASLLNEMWHTPGKLATESYKDLGYNGQQNARLYILNICNGNFSMIKTNELSQKNLGILLRNYLDIEPESPLITVLKIILPKFEYKADQYITPTGT